MTQARQADLFNGALETGMRSVVVLNAFRPHELDRKELALLDYFVVHSSQAGGPPDIHPTGPASYGEYHLRRRRIDEGIALLRRARLVDVLADQDRGVLFRAGDDAPAFVGLMHTPYNRDLIHRSEWLRSMHDRDEGFLSGLAERIEKWTLEFQNREIPGASE